MKIKQFVTLFFFIFLNIYTLLAQKNMLSGYIYDAYGEALIGATVVSTTSKKGVVSNEYGFYSLALPKGKQLIFVSYVGFQPTQAIVYLQQDTTLNFNLQANNVIQNVEINERQNANITTIATQTQMSSVKLSSEQIKKIPTIGGETDVLKALTFTPGVSSGNEGSAGIYVRGGTPDQNLILLDEAPVYNVSHLFGFISVFNTDAIKNVELIKGGFPARYGGRLSSVLDINMKEGNMQKLKGEIGVGLISARLFLEGPLKKEKTSFLVSARSSYVGLLTYPQRRKFEQATRSAQYNNYEFYDLNFKLNHIINVKNRIFMSFYKGNDDYIYKYKNLPDEEKGNLTWGNSTATIRHTYLYNSKFFVKNLFIYSKFNYQYNYAAKLIVGEDTTRQTINFLNQSGLQDFTLKSSVDYTPNDKHFIRFGVLGTNHLFVPQSIRFVTKDSTLFPLKHTNTIPAQEANLFVEDDFSINDKMSANIGLRTSLFHVLKKNYGSLEPRLSVRVALSTNLSLKAAFNSTKQYIHLLSSNNIGFPNDVWVPTTDKVAPQTAYQTSMGLAKYAPSLGIEISLEGYYKRLFQQLDFQEGTSFLFNTNKDWQDVIEKNGRGTAYGAEFFVHKKEGRLTGMFAYTWSKNTRQFSNINQGKPYFFKYDRRHDISLTCNYQLTKRWNISSSWVYYTGQAVTLPTGIHSTPFGVGTIQTYTDRNAARMPSYHRADIGINYIKQRNKTKSTWNISVYNAYNRANPYYLQIKNVYTYDSNNKIIDSTPTLFQQSLIPIVPSLNYSLVF